MKHVKNSVHELQNIQVFENFGNLVGYNGFIFWAFQIISSIQFGVSMLKNDSILFARLGLYR